MTLSEEQLDEIVPRLTAFVSRTEKVLVKSLKGSSYTAEEHLGVVIALLRLAVSLYETARPGEEDNEIALVDLLITLRNDFMTNRPVKSRPLC